MSSMNRIRLPILVLLVAIFVGGCMTRQTSTTDSAGSPINKYGYRVANASGNDHFTVTVQLPGDATERVVLDSLYRSVGEECAQRGFDYFDAGILSENSAEGFCFKTPSRKTLAVAFAKSGKGNETAHTPSFVVEKIGKKKGSSLKPGDEITKMDGFPIQSIADTKLVLFRATNEGRNAVSIEVRRNGKITKFIEPIADAKRGALGPKSLATLRRRVQAN